MGYSVKVYYFGDVTFMTLHNLNVCLCSHCVLLVEYVKVYSSGCLRPGVRLTYKLLLANCSAITRPLEALHTQ